MKDIEEVTTLFKVKFSSDNLDNILRIDHEKAIMEIRQSDKG